ncbi:DUF4132 domain-containing protein [Actinorugispora endophytica]|uniref:Uncharacterized protein DUF4132 n=1 Tax=Actinorugispora endophytica TaxID=1605990 RepID=A0A4V3D716_9ACTN|nr:DUF4132 domain-containing protein [Actinorugispora endophytica]TDQ46137.1 uncharacterized protein DUF4132 [Actinorugispora endophytica]
MGWIVVGDGYEVALRDSGDGAFGLVARNAKGRELARVPARLKKDPDVARLADLRAWLGEHEQAVRAEAEAWMLRSLPVPTALLRAVWPDAAWRRALTDFVVAPVGGGEAPDPARCGLLRAVDEARGVGVVDLDGETAWLDADALAVVHPVLLGDDLGEWRELLASLDAAQAVPQLLRQVWRRPEGLDPLARTVRAFPSADYAGGAQLEKQVIALGGRIRGETAHFSCYDGGPVAVRVELRWQGPQSMAVCHDLMWSRPSGEVGDVAWSEGVRIAATLYGNRTESGDDDPAPADAYERFRAGHPRPDGVPAAAPAPRPPRSRGELVDAGAVVAGPPAAEGEDALVACRYECPALDGPVVEATTRAAVPGQRAALALLGLAPSPEGAETALGAVRARPLGFLALALNRHPGLSDRITALLAALRANAKVAETKPGRARDALNRVASELTGPDAALLPLLYDECSRIMAEVGNTAYSVGFFDQARRAEAERAAEFPVDEAGVVAAYRDIAVRDALPKSLAEHAGALAARLPATEAYRWQRRLATEWCEAGLRAAPVLARDLASLAEAAGYEPGSPRDPAERAADERAVRALLANGSLTAAPHQAWTVLIPLLRRVAGEDPGFRSALVRLLPEPARDTGKAKAGAVSLLLANLSAVGISAPFTATPGLTGEEVRDWANRALELYRGAALPVEGLPGLLRDAGARLRAEGLSCDLRGALTRTRSWKEAPDYALFELALACGVPSDPPGPEADLRVGQWVTRGVPLPAAAADPQWGPVLRRDVLGERSGLLGLGRPHGNRHDGTRYVGDPVGFPESAKDAKTLVTAQGTAGIVAEILDGHALSASGGGLPDLYAALRDTERFTLSGIPEGCGDAVRAVVDADPAEALAAGLRAGLLDELTLPAFADFGGLTPYNLLESGSDLIVSGSVRHTRGVSRGRVAVVHPDRLGPERELRDPFHGDGAACYAVVDGVVVETTHGGEHCPHDAGFFAEGGRHAQALSVQGVEREAVRFPGADRDATAHRLPRRTVELRDADGRAVGRYVVGASWMPGQSGSISSAPGSHRYAAGTEFVVPPGWWGRMRPRDEAGSHALRRVDGDAARRMLAAVGGGLAARIVETTDARPPRNPLPERRDRFADLTALLRPLLPGVTDERLRMGVTATVWTAVECRERALALTERLRLAPPGAGA